MCDACYYYASVLNSSSHCRSPKFNHAFSGDLTKITTELEHLNCVVLDRASVDIHVDKVNNVGMSCLSTCNFHAGVKVKVKRPVNGLNKKQIMAFMYHSSKLTNYSSPITLSWGGLCL